MYITRVTIVADILGNHTDRSGFLFSVNDATYMPTVTPNSTGGWKNEAGEWISTEALNAEVYEITGIDSGVAVALKFINQGEAVTTTHYYVMMNPAADLSIVEEYVREPIVQNNPGDEMAGEVNE